MSFAFEEPSPGIPRLILKFVEEATDILDESIPLTRRVALLYKWSWVLHGLGYDKPLTTMEITRSELISRAADMLKWSAIVIKEKI